MGKVISPEFWVWKKNFLGKKDKSKKGDIDAPIKELLDTVNKLEPYFTTSSCSGRITLWVEPAGGKKNEVTFLFVSHTRVSLRSVLKHLVDLPRQPVWFRFEPAILHVACCTMQDADRLLDAIRPFFKHSGIISTRKRITIEIRGSEFIEAPVAIGGAMRVDKNYIGLLVREANKKLVRTHQKIWRCNSAVRSLY